MQNSVLLLNQGYQPLRVISWRKAAGLCIGREKAEIISEYDHNYSWFKPAVVRLIVPSPDPFKIFQKQKFSRKNLFLRDKFICQYCTKHIGVRDGTIDHVTPRAQGGKTSYLNCVAACKKCNTVKDNRTPAQASMPLFKPLRYPNMYDTFHVIDVPEEWHNYLSK
jgi:hypothetical protein